MREIALVVQTSGLATHLSTLGVDPIWQFWLQGWLAVVSAKAAPLSEEVALELRVWWDEVSMNEVIVFYFKYISAPKCSEFISLSEAPIRFN